jgi:hypothetical protein
MSNLARSLDEVGLEKALMQSNAALNVPSIPAALLQPERVH